MAAPRKLTEEQRLELLSRRDNGETQASLAKAFRISETTVRKIIARERGDVPRFGAPVARSKGLITEFIKRAKSITWRQDGKDKETYNAWQKKFKRFQKGGMTKEEAAVQASKDFACLKKLFREYDVSEHDPHPDSHPDTPAPPQPASSQGIECEGREQSHRDNLTWAIEAAGKFLRTGEEPTIAPNDAAYYLYCQAREQPKDFLGKYSQVEVKGDTDQEAVEIRKNSKRTIGEIEEMLAVISADDHSNFGTM